MKKTKKDRMDEMLLRYLQEQTTDEERATVEEWVSGSPEHERALADTNRLVEIAQMSDRRIVPRPLPAPEKVIKQALAARRGTPNQGLVPTARRLALAFPRRRYGLVAAGVIVIAGVIALVHLPTHLVVEQSGVGAEGVPLELATSTGPGETEMVQLGDGTVIRLGPESSLIANVADTIREMSFGGEAFFAVATAVGPLHIYTSGGTAQVLGARFYLANNSVGALAVTVVEGRVALVPPGIDASLQSQPAPRSPNRAAVAVLEAGQSTRLSFGRPTPIESAAPIDSLATWLDGFLIFRDTPIDVAMKEIEQRYGTEVLIADAALLDHTLTMWFDSKSLPEVMEEVCIRINARCSIGPGGVRIGAH